MISQAIEERRPRQHMRVFDFRQHAVGERDGILESRWERRASGIDSSDNRGINSTGANFKLAVLRYRARGGRLYRLAVENRMSPSVLSATISGARRVESDDRIIRIGARPA